MSIPRARDLAFGFGAATALAAGIGLAASADRLAGLGVGLGGTAWFVLGLLVALALAYAVPIPLPRPTTREGAPVLATAPTMTQTVGRASTFAAAFVWVAFAVVGPAYIDAVWPVMLAILGILALAMPLWALVQRLFAAERAMATIALEPRTLTVGGAGGEQTVIRYEDIQSLEPQGTSALYLKHGPVGLRIPVSGGAARVEALRRAIEEARLDAGRAHVVEAASPLLRRPPGTSARAWLAQIDALAATRDAGGAFRSAGLDDGTLLAMLDDEGADTASRAAAARLLTRSADAAVRVRVDEALARVASDDVRVRIELARNADVDEAAGELDALERQADEEAAGR